MAEKIKLTFLGTGGAIPTARRNHPATLLKYKDETILIDCGEGTQRQFRKAKLNPCKITKILITHWHGDHTLGLPALLQTLAMNNYNGTIEIHGPEHTKRNMETIMDQHMTSYLKRQAMEGETLEIKFFEHKPGIVIETDEWVIDSVPIKHYCNGVSYSFTIKEKNRLDKKKLTKLKIPNGPLIGQLAAGKTIEHNGKKIKGKDILYVEPSRKLTLITDTSFQENLAKFAKDSDLLICESTHAKDEEQIASDHGHLTSHQAATIAKKAKAKKLALIHLSQRYDAIPKKILEEAKEIFKDTIVPEDLDRIEI